MSPRPKPPRANVTWGCPHEHEGKCGRVRDRPCEPGMKGCVLAGRFTFADESKNRPGGPREPKRKPR